MINPFRGRKRLRFRYGIPAVPLSLLEQREEQPTMLEALRARITPYLPETRREKLHVLLVALMAGLLSNGLINENQADLWSRLGVATISLFFAWLYARETWRSYLFGIVATGGGALYAWGVAHHVAWAIVVASTAQALGMGTAAAKAVPGAPDDGAGTVSA